jgi:uncharacterized membrane protein (UPF0136 family)
MSDVLEFESRDTPFPVALAGLIGIAKAIFEAGFGLIGLAAADSVDDPFGAGVLVFGILYALASFLLFRGSRLGYYLTVALSALALVVAIPYMFGSEWSVFAAVLVSALVNALVLYLLLVRQSAREFFGLGTSAGP